MAFLGGPVGFIRVGGVQWALGKWSMSMRAGAPRVNNFTSGYQRVVSGLKSATLTISGPYDMGNMPLTVGQSADFVLGLNNPAVSLLCTAVVTEINPSQDIEDAARVTITADSDGVFTAAIT